MRARCCAPPARCSGEMKLGSFALLFVLLLGGVNSVQAQVKRMTLEHPLALAGTDGETVTSDGFPGKWLLVYFGYTHCADQCPTALSAMIEALGEIGPAADLIQPLFVTVDPERDRGAALNDFTAAFDKRLIGLTGDARADSRRGRGARHRVPQGTHGY